MKIKSKKLVAVVMFLALVFSSFNYLGTEADAATKLNATKKTLNVGKTTTVKISGAKGSVKWSASNKCIKITKKTKKYAKIKGIKAGSSVLKAKVGKKVYKCKVTVKNVSVKPTKAPVPSVKPSPTGIPVPTNTPIATQEPTKEPEQTEIPTPKPEDTPVPIQTPEPTNTPEPTAKPTQAPTGADAVESEYKQYKDGIVGFYTNNNTYDISLEVKMVYYDSDGKIIDYSIDNNYCLGAGKSTALDFHNPWDEKLNDIPYDSYEANVTVKKSYYKDSSVAFVHEENTSESSLMCSIKNIALWNVSFVQYACVFYDGAGNVIGYQDHYAKCTDSMTTDVISFRYPYDSSYNTITPASYKIFSKGIY